MLCSEQVSCLRPDDKLLALHMPRLSTCRQKCHGQRKSKFLRRCLSLLSHMLLISTFASKAYWKPTLLSEGQRSISIRLSKRAFRCLQASKESWHFLSEEMSTEQMWDLCGASFVCDVWCHDAFVTSCMFSTFEGLLHGQEHIAKRERVSAAITASSHILYGSGKAL